MLLESERQDAILAALQAQGAVHTSELATRFGVSGMTIRRDLQFLEEGGRLRRVHGGAVPLRPFQEARSSSAARSRATIGMVAPSGSYYFAPVIDGAKRAARDLGCRLVLGVSDYTEEVELQQVKRLLDLGIEGLLVTPSDPLSADSELYRALVDARVPVVVVERDLGEDLDAGSLESVRSDHAYGARLAVRHLVGLGHTSIALALRDTPTAPWVRDGFRAAVHEFGLAPDRVFEHDIARNRDGGMQGRVSLEALLDRCRASATRAVLVLTDDDAVALLDLAAVRGLRVPDDLAVVAYDDEVASLASIPLTAVAPAKHDLGHLAFSMCFERVRAAGGAAGDAAPSPARIHLLPALHVRESTVPAEHAEAGPEA